MMKENELIKKLFEDLFDGDPWLDVNLMHTLNGITPKQAARKNTQLPNSIWEIVQHVISWRQNVLQRIQGIVIATPEDNYFRQVPDTSDAAWQRALAELKTTQQQWLDHLDKMPEDAFQTLYPANNKTNYEHIHGVIQHDAYHLGQVVLLAKHF